MLILKHNTNSEMNLNWKLKSILKKHRNLVCTSTHQYILTSSLGYVNRCKAQAVKKTQANCTIKQMVWRHPIQQKPDLVRMESLQNVGRATNPAKQFSLRTPRSI